MAIQTFEEWMTEFYNDECEVGIAHFELEDGTTVKMGVASTDSNLDLEARSHFHYYYKASKIRTSTIEKVSHNDFLKIVGCKAYEVGDKVNNGRFVKMLECPNKGEQKKAEIMERFEQYELDNED